MKRFSALTMLLAICIAMMAQSKLTPQARLQVAQKQALACRQHARVNGTDAMPAADQHVTMVVRVSPGGAASTYGQLKALGAKVLSKLAGQAVISIPVDKVDAASQLDGVLRMDTGHRGRLKTDVTIQETGVERIDGTMPGVVDAYTGKGVTICLVDIGFDFQHPAFLDDEGRSRIKCVYMLGDEGGNKFVVDDDEAGLIEYPGSVYDTPELIAQLTTDADNMSHGSHTAGIAAGTRSPQGYGGMAPDADIVLVAFGKVYDDLDADDTQMVELALDFAVAYSRLNDVPMVISASLNSHLGPHDGTSTMTQKIDDVSNYCIPVMSAGNEGAYPIHLYQKFTESKTSVKTFLVAMAEDETGQYNYEIMSDVAGYTRAGDEVGIQLSIQKVNYFSGALTEVWASDKVTAKLGSAGEVWVRSSDDDEDLAKYLTGEVALAAQDNGDGRLSVSLSANGGMNSLYLFQLTVSGPAGTEIDLWDEMAGFGGVQYIGLPGYVDGDSDMSGGDWTCTDRVISVGAYCANVMQREYDGSVNDLSRPSDDDDMVYVLNDIAPFSSYGTSFNNIQQPTVCAPGVNVVSSLNGYEYPASIVADEMLWDGHPYGAESGTSMACPVVSGIIACWLQACPGIGLDDVLDALANSCRQDDYTADSDMRWGFGKIDAEAGLAYLIQKNSIRDAESTTKHDAAVYDLQGRRVNRPVHGLYIQDGHKVLVK